MNIDGATALGFTPPMARGIFCLSRALGILSHAWEQTGRKRQQGADAKRFGQNPSQSASSRNGPTRTTVADVIDGEKHGRLEFAHVRMDDGAATLDSPISPSNSDRVQGGSMLKSIDPLLNADVLYALRSMGHGDDLVLCDTNFPADSVARQTVLGRLLRIDNVSAGRAARAILSVLPLDSFVDKPASRMEIVGQPGEIPEVQREVQAAIDAAEGRSFPMGSVERFAFYELAKKSYCVIQTGERRFYGCFIFKKGVIPPDA